MSKYSTSCTLGSGSSLWELSSLGIISITITSLSSSLVQTSSALGDEGTNPSDSKSGFNLRTFLVMNAIDGSGGMEESKWFSRLFLVLHHVSCGFVVTGITLLLGMDRDGVDRTVSPRLFFSGLKVYQLPPASSDINCQEFYGPSWWKELSKESGSKILPCGDGSCWKAFKPIASLIPKGKLKSVNDTLTTELERYKE
ncbi:hypothetical protein Tco_0703131 [Tanacetum coccineum]|uniref:Uncharacterized protein n=1 Tax=Tanacetum coccineum TaxID=301880 RepID=A0ABQ4XXZ7_9ASTR